MSLSESLAETFSGKINAQCDLQHGHKKDKINVIAGSEQTHNENMILDKKMI